MSASFTIRNPGPWGRVLAWGVLSISRMRYPPIGSISSGTLHPQDLIPAFADFLESLTLGDTVLAHDEGLRRTVANALGEYQDAFTDDGESLRPDIDEGELLETLTGALEAVAGPYTYFGAHPGDGADFGFWPSLDSIEDLPTEEDAEEGEDFKEVNDHGNVTVRAFDGTPILELV